MGGREGGEREGKGKGIEGGEKGGKGREGGENRGKGRGKDPPPLLFGQIEPCP